MKLSENYTDACINTGFFPGCIPEIFVFGNDLKVDVRTGNLVTDGRFMTDQEFQQGAAKLNMSVDEYKEWMDYADTQKDLGIDVAYSTEGIDTSDALQDGTRDFYETNLAMGNKLSGSEMFEYQGMVMKDDLKMLGMDNEDVAFVKGAEFIKDGKRYLVLPDSNGILRAQDVGSATEAGSKDAYQWLQHGKTMKGQDSYLYGNPFKSGSNISDTWARQGAGPATNFGDAMGSSAGLINDYVGAFSQYFLEDAKVTAGQQRVFTDMIANTIENAINNGNIENLNPDSILQEVLKSNIPELTKSFGLRPDRKVGDYADKFTNYNNFNHVNKLVESFYSGSDALNNYYKDSSKYWYNIPVEAFKFDSYSSMTRGQYNRLRILQNRYNNRYGNN